MTTNPARLLAGRYRLEEEIATGGMGAVHRAVDERLKRPVAIKVLKEHLVGDEQALERFRREARAVAVLSHANIARVYDLCEDSDRHFIVMELVEGRDLATVIREEGALGPERAPAIAVQVCSALEQAHSLGIVHRDVKPANILLAEGDVVKVTDFGIARVAGAGTLTNSGIFLGTANYVAPEVAQGGDATEHSDIYSLGIVLFEMLTGFPPFEGKSATVVATMHADERVPRPSTKRQDVPPHLDAAVERATAKRPEDRFTGAAEFAAHLSTHAAAIDAPTAAVPIVTTSSKTRFLAKRETREVESHTPVSDGETGAQRSARSRIQGLRAIPRAWALAIGLGVAAAALAVAAELMSPEPVGVRAREPARGGPAGSSNEISDVPGPLESALERLEREVQP